MVDITSELDNEWMEREAMVAYIKTMESDIKVMKVVLISHKNGIVGTFRLVMNLKENVDNALCRLTKRQKARARL